MKCRRSSFASNSLEAEKEYYSAHNNEYAQKIFSDTGQQNGLYWQAIGRRTRQPDRSPRGVSRRRRLCPSAR